MTNINPFKDLKKDLLSINSPARYVGGEYGCIRKEDADFSVALSFPDLYEIGMSNQAVKILYSIINRSTPAACERVFSPAPDMEELLRTGNIPLYTLESGRPVSEHDMLAFTVGYELAATNMLNIIDLSGIPLRNTERTEGDPIIIAGGPAITNPVPFGDFLDAVYIGEAEKVFIDFIREASEMKKQGAGRDDIMSLIKKTDFFWYKGKEDLTKRAVWNGFGDIPGNTDVIVPSLRTVQDHGVVEVMRGCPNGCRFCHAGIFYRPFREKGVDQILSEVESLISGCGYREVTLSSLSSGDYHNIGDIIKILNARYASKKISFSFPSIRVNSFTLPLISEISKVRKSGLTFAVETPDIVHQRGLNKEAPKERIIDILSEARKMGWSKAKFYFMVGLPFFEKEDETDSIIDFLREVGRESKMNLNINLGTFIPKPHTPFQWSYQLNEEKALERIYKIKRALPDRFFKVGYQSPFMSYLEGVISRGDERAGLLIEQAFHKGARLDAWEEYIDKDIWRSVFSAADWDVEKEICGSRDVEAQLPWDGIILNVGKKFLKNEYEKAFKGELTDACSSECGHKCGSCADENRVKENINPLKIEDYIDADEKTEERHVNKLLFTFTKTGPAAFLSHINIMTVFERAFIRAGVDINYSEGFNPKPKLEFANPISLGFESDEEIASVEVMIAENENLEDFRRNYIGRMNGALPEGLSVTDAKLIKIIENAETGKKVRSLMASYCGSEYRLDFLKEGTAEKLTEELGKSGVEYDMTDSGITVYNDGTGGKKLINIFKFLRDNLNMENPFEYFEIRRIKNYCAPRDAADKYVSYYDYYQ